MRQELSGGGRPWFVRQKKGRFNCQITPASPAGWAVTAGYGAAVAGGAMLLANGDPRPVTIFAGALALLTVTILYLLAAYRMSSPADAPAPKSRRKGGWR